MTSASTFVSLLAMLPLLLLLLLPAANVVRAQQQRCTFGTQLLADDTFMGATGNAYRTNGRELFDNKTNQCSLRQWDPYGSCVGANQQAREVSVRFDFHVSVNVYEIWLLQFPPHKETQLGLGVYYNRTRFASATTKSWTRPLFDWAVAEPSLIGDGWNRLVLSPNGTLPKEMTRLMITFDQAGPNGGAIDEMLVCGAPKSVPIPPALFDPPTSGDPENMREEPTFEATTTTTDRDFAATTIPQSTQSTQSTQSSQSTQTTQSTQSTQTNSNSNGNNGFTTTNTNSDSNGNSNSNTNFDSTTTNTLNQNENGNGNENTQNQNTNSISSTHIQSSIAPTTISNDNRSNSNLDDDDEKYNNDSGNDDGFVGETNESNYNNDDNHMNNINTNNESNAQNENGRDNAQVDSRQPASFNDNDDNVESSGSESRWWWWWIAVIAAGAFCVLGALFCVLRHRRRSSRQFDDHNENDVQMLDVASEDDLEVGTILDVSTDEDEAN